RQSSRGAPSTRRSSAASAHGSPHMEARARMPLPSGSRSSRRRLSPRAPVRLPQCYVIITLSHSSNNSGIRSGAAAKLANGILKYPRHHPVTLPAGNAHQEVRAVTTCKAHLLDLGGGACVTEQNDDWTRRLRPTTCCVVLLLEVLRRAWHLQPPAPAIQALK